MLSAREVANLAIVVGAIFIASAVTESVSADVINLALLSLGCIGMIGGIGYRLLSRAGRATRKTT